jgi:hypothetical protein
MKHRYLLAIAILSAVITAVAAKAADLPDSITLPIKVIDNRAFIEVRVNGQGPFHFIIDSGGSSIVTTSLVRRLGLKTYGPFEGKGVGEKPIPAAHCDLSDVEIGHLSFPHQKIVTADLDDIKNAIGFEALDGIIGYELFAAWVVAIDFDKRTVTLTRPSAYTDPSNAVVLPLRIIDRLPVVAGSIAGLPATFSLDTGDRWWLTLHTPFVAKHQMIEKYHPGIRALTGWGGGGPVAAYVTRVEGLTVGSVNLGVPLTRFPITRSGAFTRADISGNIGAGILRHMKVTFDYADGKVIFANISSIDGSYDRSGTWLSQSGDNFKVASVVENGPAGQAGIDKGDLIVFVNGKSTREWFLPDLRDRLCDPHIDSMTMVVRSHDHLTTHTIHLRTLVEETTDPPDAPRR